MRKSPITLFGTCAIVLMSSLALAPAAHAATHRIHRCPHAFPRECPPGLGGGGPRPTCRPSVATGTTH